MLGPLSLWLDHAPLSQLRQSRGAAAQAVLGAAGAGVQRVDAAGVPAEWHTPAEAAATGPTLLYLHGGGWTLGLYAGHRHLVAELSRGLRRPVLAVDYRLAPEHPFPAGLEDCLTAYRWLLRQGLTPDEIFIGGDSAGGNFTLALLLQLKAAGEPLPAGGVCLSPAVDLVRGDDWRRVRDPLLPMAFAERLRAQYVGENDPRDPRLSPLYGDLRGLPPLLIQVGEAELLHDSARRFAEQARAAGVAVQFEAYPAMWHVWQLLAPWLPEARQALASIGRFVAERRLQLEAEARA